MMKTKPRRSVRVALRTGWAVAALAGMPHAHAAEPADNHQHAHVHGIATVGIAVDRDIVSIQLEAPLDSLIGFEHRAKTASERAAIAALQTRMKSATELFTINAAANCKLQDAVAESALFAAAGTPSTDEHADLDARFTYRCEHIDRLLAIETGLFIAYPRLLHLDVSVATGKGQHRRELHRPDHTIALDR